MLITKKRQKALDYLNESKGTIALNRATCSNDLTVLSFGGGQDSTALLLMYISDEKFRRDFAPGKFIVVMSDTGDEHDYTYANVEAMKKLCSANGIPFYFLEAGDTYHTPAWPDAITPQLREEGGEFKPTMIQLSTKSCTDKLKIQPIYKFLDAWLNTEFDYGFKVQKSGGCNKKAFNKFVEDNGRIRVLIGFAFEEETRAMASRKLEANTYTKINWEKGIFREFPLIDLQMNRSACQNFIKEQIGSVPMPSNCMRCPYMSKAELLWLYRNAPEKFNEWVKIEAKKMARDAQAGVEKNHGVFNKVNHTLLDSLSEAQEQFGDYSDLELDAYKMSHGCDGNNNF